MELKEFVKNVLIEIDEAISEARQQTDRDISFSSGKDGKRTVEFDIAVTVESEDEKGGGGGIKVLGVDLGGGVNAVNKNSVVSRISFGVDISHLTKSESAQMNNARISRRNSHKSFR